MAHLADPSLPLVISDGTEVSRAADDVRKRPPAVGNRACSLASSPPLAYYIWIYQALLVGGAISEFLLSGFVLVETIQCPHPSY